MDNTKNLETIAKTIRKRSLEIAFHSGKNGSHLGGGLSMVEIFTTLYSGIMDVNLLKSQSDNRDRIVVSKGHCVLSYYSILEYHGLLMKQEVDSFETNGSTFHGHATRDISKGIEFSGGSLSMGMSYAVGVAMACKKKGLNNRVYVIVGDGECDEGLIWEAAMSAANYKLDNLTVIVDQNRLQYDGYTENVMNSASLSDKFSAFGFNVIEVDGHSCEGLYNAFNIESKDTPTAIIANTVKGKGVSFMEDKKEWHHSELREDQYQTALNELL